MAGLGFSFGTNKQTQKSATDITKNTTTDQSQSQVGIQSGTTSTTGSQSQTGQTASSGTSTTTQAGGTTSTGATSQQQQQTTQLFDDPTLKGISGAVAQLLSHIGLGTAASAAGAGSLGAFDPAKFVSQGMEAARSSQQGKLDESINGLMDSVGGTANTNSMTALLANRMRGDAAANLAGIDAQLTGQGQEIARSNVLAGNQIDSTQNQFLAQLLDALKGGAATTSGQVAGTQVQSGTTAQTGTTATAESGTSAQQQTSQQDTTTTLINLLNTLLHGTENTVGTENTTGTTKKSGGGMSLSL
jgi:hypothetical protein